MDLEVQVSQQRRGLCFVGMKFGLVQVGTIKSVYVCLFIYLITSEDIQTRSESKDYGLSVRKEATFWGRLFH